MTIRPLDPKDATSPRDAAIRHEIVRLRELIDIRESQFRYGHLDISTETAGELQGWKDARKALEELVGIEEVPRHPVR